MQSGSMTSKYWFQKQLRQPHPHGHPMGHPMGMGAQLDRSWGGFVTNPCSAEVSTQ